MSLENRCVCCGEIIPEGRMVCPKCEQDTYAECAERLKKILYEN